MKNTELASAQVREFIEILPKALNKAAMSTYEKIIAEVKTQSDSLLAEERQRTASDFERLGLADGRASAMLIERVRKRMKRNECRMTIDDIRE